MVTRREYRSLFLGDLPNFKILWQHKTFVNTGECGAGNSKCYSSNFHWISAKLYEDMHCHGGIQAIYLATSEVIKCGTFLKF